MQSGRKTETLDLTYAVLKLWKLGPAIWVLSKSVQWKWISKAKSKGKFPVIQIPTATRATWPWKENCILWWVPELLCHRKDRKLHRVPRATPFLSSGLQKGDLRKVQGQGRAHPMQRNEETVLQMETGRVGSPEPNQSKSEGSSDLKTDHMINSRSRKRLIYSMIVLIQEQEPANKIDFSTYS